MKDDIQPAPQPNEENGGTKAPATKKSSKLSPYIAMFGVGGMVIVAFVIGLAIAFSFIKFREPAPNTTALAQGFHCDSWDTTPVGFQTFIEAKSSLFGIKPALLAAIYKQENGQSWKKEAFESDSKDWPVSPSDAAGPFQFIPDSWLKASKSGEYQNKCLPGTDVNDLDNAGCGAAYWLSNNMTRLGIDTGSSLEIDIRSAAVSYNANTGMVPRFVKWKNGDTSIKVLPKGEKINNNDEISQETIDYQENVWATFQDLNVGCQSYTSTDTATLLAGSYTNIKWDKKYMAKTELLSWLAQRKLNTNKKLIPTGWTLHWTGGSSAAGAYGGMAGRDPKVFVHLMVDYDGNIYQLMPLNMKQAGSGTGVDSNGKSANNFTLGIEIVGVGEQDLENHPVQKAAVVNLINEVSSKLGIEKVRGSTESFEVSKGIFGHFQTGGGGIIGCSSNRKTDPGKNYLKEIWDSVGATGTGCEV